MKKFTFYSVFLFAAIASSYQVKAQSGYISGDFHQHSTYTDGSFTLGHMMQKNADFGLDWWVNSEHGGAFPRWGLASGADLGTEVTWEEAGITLKGDPADGKMWRWQALKEWTFTDIQMWRRILPAKLIIQGYEMNVPGHEHGSIVIIGEQMDSDSANVDALAEFEYKFDNSDKDTSGGAAQGWSKSELSGHEKTLEAIKWMHDNYAGESWLVPAHPERKKKYTIAHFRDMNNAGPDVCFGFESMPGHQKSSNRGGYSSSADGGGVYGGCGVYAAKIGGLWDAILSEGREFWLFASSDCHYTSGDFYPGEYEKTYTYVEDKTNAKSIAAGLRSGNSFIVLGDLIDSLSFTIGNAMMGQTKELTTEEVTLKIQVRDPETANYNTYSDFTNPELNHIDIIAGVCSDLIDPSDSTAYAQDSVETTKVVARFAKTGGETDAAGIVTQAWTEYDNGVKEITFNYPINSGEKLYFRLRGTNQGVNTEGETDEFGNPILDPLGENTAEKAFADLWFYSNPIFVKNTTTTTTTTTTSTKSLSIQNDFTITPNPADDFVTVNFTKAQNGILTIYNINGSVVTQLSLNNEQQIKINVSNYKSGTYIVSLNNSSSQKLNIK